MTQPSYWVDGQIQERLPKATGVYRFFSDQGALLYVGKTIDFQARIRSHYQTARKEPRHAKLMQGVTRIECQTTADELSALLVESQAVKSEQPLFNRRLRKKRALWTAELLADNEGYCVVKPRKVEQVEQLGYCYGLFANQTQLKNWLRNHAAEHGLCLHRVGLDRGKGRCFGRQIKRCDGACCGEQSAEAYNAALLDLFAQFQLVVWPYHQPLWVREWGDSSHSESKAPQGTAQGWHVFHYWTYLGSFERPKAGLEADFDWDEVVDRDAYRILLSFLRNDRVALHQLDQNGDLVAVSNRFL
ncbi:nucleotide excision repair endonuclease [Aequoribacter fuscus]|nr:GIY-YIG nuclease family protein [Aequoribacter fuscus]QHJ88527.1 nucleotide excision repair endonuclease [Aequoribacter fuscus]